MRGRWGGDRHFSIIKYKRRLFYYIATIIILFIIIGFLTTSKPNYRISSQVMKDLINEIDSSVFLYLMGMEAKVFKEALPEDKQVSKLSTVLFNVMTNVKPKDIRSLLGQEIPGLFPKTNIFIVKSSGIDYTNFSFESSPPIKDILEERKAIFTEEEKAERPREEEVFPSTGEEKLVFIYNSHNRESFLPHLPEVTDPNLAHHKEVNISKVSEYLAQALEQRGIGTEVDYTDHMQVLKDNGWTYGQSYRASRKVIQNEIARNQDVKYLFDLHRDALPREKTTTTIKGQSYGQILIVIGAEHKNYENNLSFATEIHQRIDEKYPGLSKGIITKQGPGNNGIYNQDILDTSLLFEFGGYENSLDELFRTAEILAEVFSDYYWEAEQVLLEE